MERHNWQSRIYYPKEKRKLNNRTSQFPYGNRQSSDDQECSSNKSYSSTYSREGCSYPAPKREVSEKSNEYYKTNVCKSRYLPYNKRKSQWPRHRPYNLVDDNVSSPEVSHPSTSSEICLLPVSPEEAKAVKLIDIVRSQNGVAGMVVLMQADVDNAASILQQAVQSIKNGSFSVVSGTDPQSYELKINEEIIAEGRFISKQAAKTELCEMALSKLRKTCFLIRKRKNYQEISTDELNKTDNTPTPKPNVMEGSKAHLMMLKMGWGGKGLGINEQGEEKTVAETLTRNVVKEGLGGKNIMAEINNILYDFACSTKLTTLAFDSGFNKEERASIHKLASKLNLKSKSEGKDDNRRITIGKKIARWDLVKELLMNNCENETYTLVIPSDFENVWLNE